MKRIMAAAAVAVLGFAVSAAAIEIKEKSEVKVTGDKTVEKTEVKAGTVEVKEKVTTTEDKVVTEEKVKGKRMKMEKKTVETPEGEKGHVKVHIKKGALADFSIDYNYHQEGTEYILEYTVKDRADPELLAELGLTKDQADLVTPGKHRIVSTSPYMVDDVRADFQAVIIKDMLSRIKK